MIDKSVRHVLLESITFLVFRDVGDIANALSPHGDCCAACFYTFDGHPFIIAISGSCDRRVAAFGLGPHDLFLEFRCARLPSVNNNHLFRRHRLAFSVFGISVHIRARIILAGTAFIHVGTTWAADVRAGICA